MLLIEDYIANSGAEAGVAEEYWRRIDSNCDFHILNKYCSVKVNETVSI
jgi:hypothetical protein